MGMRSNKPITAAVAAVGLVVLVATGVLAKRPILQAWYLRQLESDNERGPAAQKLLTACLAGKLTQRSADKICRVLERRLQKMADGMPWRTGIFESELELAWELILRDRVPPEQLLTFLAALDWSWCDYAARESAYFELHGKLTSPPRGLVVHHVLRVTAVDAQPLDEVVLEMYLCPKRNSHLGWSHQESGNVVLPSGSRVAVQKTSTYYAVPVDLVEPLPRLTGSSGDFERVQGVLASEFARKLCESQTRGELTEAESWKVTF